MIHDFIEPLQDDPEGRIVAHAPHGQQIDITCRFHPEKLWSTKNIAPIGCRTIFYNLYAEPGMGAECSCLARDLRPVKPK